MSRPVARAYDKYRSIGFKVSCAGRRRTSHRVGLADDEKMHPMAAPISRASAIANSTIPEIQLRAPPPLPDSDQSKRFRLQPPCDQAELPGLSSDARVPVGLSPKSSTATRARGDV